MSTNDQLDEQAADLRNFEAQSALRSAAQEAAGFSNGKRNITKREIVVVLGVVAIIMAFICYAIFKAPPASVPAYHLTCPKDQKNCPPSSAQTP